MKLGPTKTVGSGQTFQIFSGDVGMQVFLECVQDASFLCNGFDIYDVSYFIILNSHMILWFVYNMMLTINMFLFLVS